MDDFTPAAAPGEHSLVFKRRMLLLLVGVCIAASCVLLSGAGMELKDIKATKDDQRQQITKEQQTDWQLEGQALARIYASRAANDYDWCIATSKQKKNNKDASGLLFVKIYKCASSTGSGITLSIAHNVGKRLNNSTYSAFCQTSTRHHQTQHLDIPERNHDTSFLWTLLRHPAKRVVSHFFFKRVSRDHVEPTNKNMLEYMQHEKNFQLHSLQEGSLQNYTLANILQELDFVGVVERMDESLVVLQLLMGLQPADMVVLSSKRSGGYDSNKQCQWIQPSFITAKIQNYLETAFIKDNLDYVLYAAANASLDKTIHALGRELVEKQVQHHKQLQQIAEEACLERATFPCSAEGVYQPELAKKSCYESDWGCGHECVSETLMPFT